MPRDSGRSRYHPIEDGLWCDEKFDANNGMPEAPFLTRAFFAFLASNRLQRPSGIYRATIRELAASSRLPEKEVAPLLEELERRELVIRDRSWLFLPGYLKRQAHNPSVLSAVRANLSSCSSFIILDAFKQEYPLFSSICPTVVQPSTDGGHNVSTPTVPTGPQVPVPVPEQYQKEHSVGSDDPTAFVLLWKTYPSPKGPKQDALKAFKEVHPPENVIALLEVQLTYKQSCDSRGEFCPQLPHLHRWLKKRRWEDEIPTIPEQEIKYPRLEDPKTAWKTKERYREALAAGRISPRERIPEWEPTESPASSAVSAGSLSACPDGVRIVAPGPSISPRSDGTPAGTG